MAILSVGRPSAGGSALSLVAAAAGGDSFVNDGATEFLVKNAGAGARTLTFVSPNACSFGVTNAVHNYSVVVPNDSAIYRIGTFSQGRFNDPTTGRVQVTYSSEAGLTVGVAAR